MEQCVICVGTGLVGANGQFAGARCAACNGAGQVPPVSLPMDAPCTVCFAVVQVGQMAAHFAVLHPGQTPA